MSMLINSYIFGIPTGFAPNVLADAPYFYYRLGEASGSVAADYSGNGRPGTIFGTAPTNLLYGQTGLVGDADTALKYITNAGYVRSAAAYNFTATNWSMMCAVKPDAAAAAGTIIGLGAATDPNATNTSRDQSMYITAAGLLGAYIYSGAQRNLLGGEIFNDNTAKMIHLVSGGGSTDLYRNGVLVASVPFESNQAVARYLFAGMLSFSDVPGGSANGLRGVQDEVAYFNYKLTPARILAHANAALLGPKPYPKAILARNPVCYLRMGDVLGNLAIDSSGNGKHWTYSGDPSALTVAGLLTGDGDKAIQLPNSLSQIKIAANPMPTNVPWTFGCLVKLLAVPSQAGLGVVAQLGNNGGSCPEIALLDAGSGTYRVRVSRSGVGDIIYPTKTYLYGTVLRLWIRQTSTTVSLIVNGIVEGTFTGTFANYTGESHLGYAKFAADGYPMPGVLDEVSFFNYALTDAQIAAIDLVAFVQTNWSATNKSADITVYNGTDVDSNSTGNTGGTALSEIGKTAGKYYVEFTNTQSYSGGTAFGVGLHRLAAALTNFIGQDANGWGEWAEGAGSVTRRTYTNNVGTNSLTTTFGLNQIARMAVDLDSGRVWLAHFNASGWVGGGDPAAGTTPTYSFTPGGDTFYLAASPRGGATSPATNRNMIRLVQPTAWANPAPTGFGVWG